MCIYLSIYLSIYPSIYLSIYLSIYISISIYRYRCTHACIHPSIYRFYALLFARSGWRDMPHVAPYDGIECAEVLAAGGEEAAEGGRGGVAEL